LYKAQLYKSNKIILYLFFSKGIFLPNLRYYSSSFFIKNAKITFMYILYQALKGGVVIEWNKTRNAFGAKKN
jgi:hypothetical protein